MHPIDGGLATELEARGHDLSDALWSARVLIDQPDEVRAVHESYAQAGARVLISASYQVSREGFVADGRTAHSADQALRASVALARAAAAHSGALVAASVGPFGAIRHDGSEYRGDYGVSHDRLVDFHAERLAVLVESEPDLLAIETIPDVQEVGALVETLAGFPHVPAWLSLSCRDDHSTCAGQPIEEAAAVAGECPSILAIGVNCTAPEYVAPLLERLSAVTDLALVAYPNAGRAWDPLTGWQGQSRVSGDDLVRAWAEIDRVRFIGGCCGVGPSAIAGISRSLTSST